MSSVWLTIWIFFNRRHVFDSKLFDESWYRLAHPYIVRDKIDPFAHFCKYGREHRLSPSRAFDSARYLDQHEDARRSKLNPLMHYLKRGRSLGLEIHIAPPSESDRVIESGLFDGNWYLENYADVAAANYDPLLHYMLYGAFEGRSPGPRFDAEWYLSRYPDIRGSNPLLHYIDHGQVEGRMAVRPQEIISLAEETVRSVEDLDPELYAADYFDNTDSLVFVDGQPRSRVSRALMEVIEALHRKPKAIVFLPWLVHGGADLVAGHAVRALIDMHGIESVLVIIADHNKMEAKHLLPNNVRWLSFSEIDSSLSLHERVELIDLLLRGLRPEAILNVNSRACWEAIKSRGYQLRQFTRLYAMLFCPDYSASGRRSGYSDIYLRDCLPYMSGIYFDNSTYIDEVVRQFYIPDEMKHRLIVLRQPASLCSNNSRRSTKESGGSLQVLWAGRFSTQKNINLLVRITELAPQFTFHIWGRGDNVLEERLKNLAKHSSHVQFHGPFQSFDTLPLGEYDVLLYTSLWDGIPNVLLEAAGSGLAIVSSNVGGIGELVDGTTGWPIDDLNDPRPYVAALQNIATDPSLGEAKRNAMHHRLLINHSWEKYRKILYQRPFSSQGLLNLSSDN